MTNNNRLKIEMIIIINRNHTYSYDQEAHFGVLSQLYELSIDQVDL